MNEYFKEISAADIIKKGRTAGFGGVDYIIYIGSDKRVHINGDYRTEGKKSFIGIHYDRRLCDTLDEYRSLDPDKIESQAYGAYMDGAR